MADSVDRVFVHALGMLKKIPRTGAPRPSLPDRLRLYGLYKQALEGDVQDFMARPTSASGPGGARLAPDDLQREKDKWDAWHSQRGIDRIDAKRRYVEALIEIMRRHATTPDARELASELEFVWGQIKDNNGGSGGGSGSGSSPDPEPSKEPNPPPLHSSYSYSTLSGTKPSHRDHQHHSHRHHHHGHRHHRTGSGRESPMRILTPMTEQEEVIESERRLSRVLEDAEDVGGVAAAIAAAGSPDDGRGGCDRWARRVETALDHLSAEVAALREKITTGREWKARRQRSVRRWIGWAAWVLLRHVAADLALLGLALLVMRKRGDPRLEDLVRGVVRMGREYARKMLPGRMPARPPFPPAVYYRR